MSRKKTEAAPDQAQPPVDRVPGAVICPCCHVPCRAESTGPIKTYYVCPNGHECKYGDPPFRQGVLKRELWLKRRSEAVEHEPPR